MVKTLHLSGSYEEIGYQHGKFGKEQIIQSLETYESLFYQYSQIKWSDARKIASGHMKAIEQYDQDLIEEMEGVARGAGVDFDDILALNCRSEIALTSRTPFADGCTAIGVTPPLADDIIIGQNWDWKAKQRNSLLLLKINQKGKPSITMVTEGGIIGKIGMNNRGIGVCLNALITNKCSKAVPIHLGLRGVLNSFHFHEVITKLKGGQMASAANFLIGHHDKNGVGMTYNVEVSPFGIELEASVAGKVVHTNHICSTLLKEHLEDRNEFIHEDSMVRKSRAEQLVFTKRYNREKITEEDFQSWFSDTYNAPNSINHFENADIADHRRMETVFSVVMNLSQQKMYLCAGKPSVNQYYEVTN